MRSGTTAFPRSMRLVSALAAAAVLAVLPAGAAHALTEPTVPEPVATYVAADLLPRLQDLYGPGKKEGSGTDFTQAKVGTVHRVLSFTADYLSGDETENPTELTNTWVTQVTLAENEIAGLATVWINPESDEPELATFTIGPDLATALAGAPAGTLLVRDDQKLAWFATDGTTLTPLVEGGSGVTSPVSLLDYQKTLSAAEPVTAEPVNQGVILAAVVLGIVVLALAVFILLPERRRRKAGGESPPPASDD